MEDFILKKLLFMLFVVMMFFLYACGTKLTTTPDVNLTGLTETDIKIVVSGKIDYSGQPDYLPNTISDNHDESSDIKIKYEYMVSYGGTKPSTDIITAFIPTTLLGTPTGNNELVIQGKLDIYKNSIVTKSYMSECIVRKPRNVWSGINYTELRRKGLIAIKENIELQMMYDRDVLRDINVNGKL